MSTTSKAQQVQTPAASRPKFTLWHLSLILVVIALAVTGYMTYTKLAGNALVCVESGLINCSVVESSAWATVMGIPTAFLGFIAHVLLGAALLLERRIAFFRNNGPLIMLGIALFGVFYHTYLTYVSVAILRALCPWCLTAFSLMVGQLLIAITRSRRLMASE